MTEQFSLHSSLPPHAQQRLSILHDYMQAMEYGDAEAILTILQAAEHDAVLERMILDMNAAYQHEDHTEMPQSDVILAQNAIAAAIEITGSTAMPKSHLDDSQDLVELHTTITPD